MSRLAVIFSVLVVAIAGTALPALAVPPTVTGTVIPAVQGLGAPLGDVAIVEASSGQLTMGDTITYRLVDSLGGSTIHLTSTPVVGGTHSLSATAAVTSSSGVLNDQVEVRINQGSVGSFPGVLTLAGLIASVDPAAAAGNDTFRVWDSAAIIASSGTPATTSNANLIGIAAKSTFSAIGMPTIASTGYSQVAGDLTITEPAKVFFKTGDIITFSIRDSLGSGDTVGLASAPTVSGGGMLVHVAGLSGGAVQPNDTGFKVVIDQQDPSNGSASTLQVSDLVYNTGQAPTGPVGITAIVTTGVTTEYVFPGRVNNAAVGGATTTTSAGEPVLQLAATAQPAANLTILETPGALKLGSTVSLVIQEPGVTFNTAPLVSIAAGDLQFSSSTATLDGPKTTATWAVSRASTMTSTAVVGPFFYDVAAIGPVAGDLVTVLATGSTGGGFTSQTVVNAKIAPASATLFTATSAPNTPAAAANVAYLEVVGQQALTGGSIVLLSPYATQIKAYRATFASIPAATVTNPASGLVLGPPVVNAAPLAVQTPDGPVTAPAETAVVFPVTTGSVTPANVSFSGISYSLGTLVRPGALVGTGVVTTGASGGGTSVAGNDYANAVNPSGLGGGGGTPIYKPDAMLKLSTGASFVGNGIYNTTGANQSIIGNVARGKKVILAIQVQNDGNNSDTFTIKGGGNQKPFTVKYFDGPSGTTDITLAVTGSGFTTLTVGPTSSATIRLQVTASKTAIKGTKKAWVITATSGSDPLQKDAVKATVKAV